MKYEVFAPDFVEGDVFGVGEGDGAAEQGVPRGRSAGQGWVIMWHTVVGLECGSIGLGLEI